MKSFFVRTLAVAMALACLFLIEAAIIGTLPLLAAALVPAAFIVTGRVFRTALRPARRRGGPRTTPAARAVAAPAGGKNAAPATGRRAA